MRRIWRNRICRIAILGGLLLITGCSSTELEERCFPMLAAVGIEGKDVTFDISFPNMENAGAEENTEETDMSLVKNRSFAESKREYESYLNKKADYNHLKVLVIELEFLKKENLYTQMLDDLAKTECFPRNTYVCVVDDIEKLVQMEGKLSQDLGTYLEEYIDKQEEAKTHILTLGDLLDEKENQLMILFIPYLEVEKKSIHWAGYVNTQGEIWKEFR